MGGSQDATINNKSKEQIEVMDRKDIQPKRSKF